jgi:structural toxin protein (hemagglutinin/hemolysin) RtxA
MYYLYFYVPETHLDEVKEKLFEAGAGKLGSYERCAWQVKGEGQFLPLIGSHPYLGKVGEVKQVAEYKVEMLCAAAVIEQVIAALKAVHPYEQPGYGVVKLQTW